MAGYLRVLRFPPTLANIRIQWFVLERLADREANNRVLDQCSQQGVALHRRRSLLADCTAKDQLDGASFHK